MRIAIVGTVLVALTAVLAPAARADLISKSYEFRGDVTLELAASTESGLRLDNIRFRVPPVVDDKVSRTAGLANATLTISNIGEKSRKVGVALALFDAQDRLLGVAATGSSMMSLRGGRQKTYTLVFDFVNSEIHRATRFQISLESKP